MKNVQSVEVHLSSCERGVGTGVMPERTIAARRLQDDAVRGRRPCCGQDALQAESLLGGQVAGDLTQRVIADPRADAGRYPGSRKGESGICHRSTEGGLCRADLVELAGHEFGNTGQLGSDVDAQMPGDQY